MTAAPPIDTLEAARHRLAATAPGGRVPVRVDAAVPGWLGELVAEASFRSVAVVVVAVVPADLAGEARDGWEIGVATAALAAGAQVEGIAARRVGRVAEVDRRWSGR